MAEQLFCTPPKLAEETGIDVRVIRDMCEKRILPSEIYNGRFRILHDRAIRILTKRAEEFEGHYRPERSPVIEAIRERRAKSHGLSPKQMLKLDKLSGLA